MGFDFLLLGPSGVHKILIILLINRDLPTLQNIDGLPIGANL